LFLVFVIARRSLKCKAHAAAGLFHHYVLKDGVLRSIVAGLGCGVGYYK
jgi:cytochrome b561